MNAVRQSQREIHVLLGDQGCQSGLGVQPAPLGVRVKAYLRSNIKLGHKRDVVRWLLPRTGIFEHTMPDGLRSKLARGPHMVEPPSTIILAPVG